uniref:Glucose-6-phosphate isomerase, archaeal II / Mannose-6-phosphate isomerase, archaeal n=1 Tax=uncultured Armatimonadetes bacterium TaxID=157466 RepID=A0A6J4J6Q6_9BACT|nr:Glucose-6-phosphate isomerase, archaeal II / Mannose-6-phosphate isomerase, archaeal [uncultured Armatimonadetes bacterium]
MAVDLDDAGALKALDPLDMMGLTLGFPEQCATGLRLAREADLKPLSSPPSNVVVTGLGGSAIGGDMLRAVIEAQGRVPCGVNRDYHLPAYVGPDTLVITASYSGNTEETLSAYAQAHEAGAQILAVTSGGTLAERARSDGHRVILVPGGQPPRSATGYLFFPMLVALERLGLLPDQGAAIDETIARLRAQRDALGPGVPAARNPAKQLASALHGKVPVVHGTTGYLAVVAFRWKCQFNENAKTMGLTNAYPELDHNEIIGWVEAPTQAANWALVTLRDPDLSPKMQKRVDVTTRLIGERAAQHVVTAEGDSLLARMLGTNYLGDFVSVYLAYAYGVDPTVIENIDTLKVELAGVAA